jgi:hypothetical protein
VPKAVNSTVKREAKPTKKIMSPRDFFNQSW